MSIGLEGSGFRCSSERGPSAVRVTPHGELDGHHVDAFERAVDDALGHGTAVVVIDLSELKFVDSSGIAAFLRVEKRVQASGRKAVFAQPTTAVRKILAAVGLTRHFRLSDERTGPECPICESTLGSAATRCPHCGSRLP